jgi:two-component system response regulator GlrR
MDPVVVALERAAATDVHVVLYGETGVGKSFSGTELHRRSRRRKGPLKRFSVRSQDAAARLAAPGLRDSLEGGTLLLEGLDDASPEVQKALVGVLEEWAVAEDGGEAPVRVVATSERGLGELVDLGEFRADLYYLLEVFPLCLPPLRQRAEEIPQLVAEFVRRRGMRPEELPELPLAFLEQAMIYEWPGNLRELASVVDRALPATSSGEWAVPPLLYPSAGRDCLPPFHTAKREFEESYVNRLLLVTGGNVTRAAEIAGKARKDFYALMSRNRVDPARFRPGSNG